MVAITPHATHDPVIGFDILGLTDKMHAVIEKARSMFDAV